MRKLSVLFLGLAAALALVLLVRPAAAAPSARQSMELTAELRGGAEEVPNPGDPDGTGTSTVTIDMAGGQISYTINASNITLPASAAHIHEGEAGVAGPVVVPLTQPGADGKSSGSAMVDAALLQRIQQNPAGFYVNVHTSDFPSGAMRGQLASAGGSAAPAPTAQPAAAPAAGGAAPATLPNTGANDDSNALLGGLALFALMIGLGLRFVVRRNEGTR